MAPLLPYLLVGVGGFVGANARFLVTRWAGGAGDTPFPLGTFVVNVAGSFLLGVVGSVVARRLVPYSDAVRLALAVGFLGSFTTFSTFAFETHALVEDGAWVLGLFNVLASVALGLLAIRAGILTANAWLA